MKTPVLIAVVVMLHVTAIGSLFMIQGCGKTRDAAMPPPVPSMPPAMTTPARTPAPTTRPLPPPSVATRPLQPSAPVDTVEYVVRTGDTLSKIASKHKVPISQVVELNKISDPNRIRVGQKLIVPAREGVTLHKPVTPKSSTAATGDMYVVQVGDTLSGIAHRFGTKVSTLRELNSLSGDKILAGQKLKVVGATQAAPVSAAASKPAAELTPAVEPETAPEVTPEFEEASPTADVDTTVSGQEIIHVVMPNEDVDYIARLYVVSVNDIVKLNNLTEPKVEVGQRLRIP